jgi:hypothetical protein
MSITTDERYAYRPGLIFLSKHAGYTMSLWPERYHTYPDGQREMVEPPGGAEFDLGLQSAPEFIPEDEDGNPVTTAPVIGMENYHSMSNVWADIRGGAFDLDAAVVYYGWSDDQRDMAAFKLLRIALDPRHPEVTLFEPTAPEPPWPTYDKLQNYLEIAKLADDLGLLEEAFAYETYTKKRKGVLEALQLRRSAHEAEAALVAE